MRLPKDMVRTISSIPRVFSNKGHIDADLFKHYNEQ